MILTENVKLVNAYLLMKININNDQNSEVW